MAFMEGAAYGSSFQSLPMDPGVPVGTNTSFHGIPAPIVGPVVHPEMNGSFVAGGSQQIGVEHVRLRVPSRQLVRTVVVPGPLMNQVVQAPPREVVRKVFVQAPGQIQKVQVQAPGREVVRRVAVPGPERVVKRQVHVAIPREVIKREAVQGPPREVIKRVEIPGPAREVIRRVEVQGPPREQIQTVQVAVPGPPREVVRKVVVPRDIVRQVVKHVNVDQWVDQPVPVQGPGAVRLNYLVDQPPVTIAVPHQVFRTQLVPTVVLMPQTVVGVATIPQTVPQPPRVVPGPIVPEHVAAQMGAPPAGPPAPFTIGGFGAGPIVSAPVVAHSVGGFAPPEAVDSGALHTSVS